MQSRRRFKQSESLKDRLASFAKDALCKARHLPSGPERDELLKKARQADAASRIDQWASSPRLQPPK